MAHGGGGSLTQQLIDGLFARHFANPILAQQHDAAALSLDHGRIAITTDSFVVQPLFFPGGDIGSLAVYGTVNDLLMAGAEPRYLTAGFILEEGLPMETLERIVISMAGAAAASGVTIVAGDTKTVNRGHGDGVFINTTGIGLLQHGRTSLPSRIESGDAIVLSGDLGRHGMAVMAAREQLDFSTPLFSDAASLRAPVEALYAAGLGLHCMRDLTRGGLASALNELSDTTGLGCRIDEAAIGVSAPVRGACELLGLDPLYVANEGRFIAVLPAHEAAQAVAVLQTFECGQHAAVIGHVEPRAEAPVLLRNRIGTTRILDRLTGEQLPRIC
ncbi:MAG: hydrogenase expression/formation protein HypE [Candidatus Hydrogenedentes bacterium]|nr:hydrogenase expression/formation protein HypE [Candidatus Hydrogenedentota bacterium]